jgi:hypothetical protein
MLANTELKRPEKARRVVGERFRAISGQTGVGMALVGLDGRLLRINHKIPRAETP